MAPSHQSNVPAKFQCALTKQLMEDPIMTVHGYNFEKQVLLHWFAIGNRFCPLTNEPLSPSATISNQALKREIEFWKEQNAENSKVHQDWSTVDVSNVGLFVHSPTKKESSNKKDSKHHHYGRLGKLLKLAKKKPESAIAA